MKKIYLFPFLTLFLACNSSENKEQSSEDSVEVVATTPIDSTIMDTLSTLEAPERLLLELNQAILTKIENNDLAALEVFIHPEMGLQLSPYAHVNRSEDVVIQKADFVKAVNDSKKIAWGQFDGTGDPIELSVSEYFNKFVYDVDFLNAEKVTINASSSSGNIINNINTAFDAADYVENYFSGFNQRYQGMDWRALRLVFKKDGDQYYLIAFVHDQWTT